ncbi:4'-phosphopantetheinyl transferase family protein [Streptomyces sp. TP-A0874]|uniref:4'-phosphopantetheinyl transferase family protein n=1 Tax=Streptomyces sp. TP-A0874 TaxID=549819 RepID=UPI0008537C9E|nr:4'-phosphopantetheinyl transferase superfamily protein [Streptomyces sp. TP-A0874]
MITPTTLANTDVWWWKTPDAAVPADFDLLGPAERERAARMRSSARATEFITYRAAVRRILADVLGTTPERIELGRRACPECGDGDHGPPAVVHPANDLWISVSHTPGIGGLAVADSPVGLDVERVRDVRTELLAPSALSPAESAHLGSLAGEDDRTRAFLRCWTRKEAVLKAVGIGMVTDLTLVESHPEQDGPVRITAGAPGTPQLWTVTDIEAPGPAAAAIARPHGD